MTTTVRTRVAIVGAGPAGLVLSHLLADAGIDPIVVDSRSREQIESTIRAGILEQNTVELPRAIGPGTRVEHHRHTGDRCEVGLEIDDRHADRRRIQDGRQQTVQDDLVRHLDVRHTEQIRQPDPARTRMVGAATPSFFGNAATPTMTATATTP
jgi:2-polyprenyl-6-methoxyphenol hydroxylase-like FAD-dependent oxidoreductase